ncbi:MAG: 2-C-methyl-D-erythritol 4-phosphate cytidylyltransferase [Treponema sp.]|jgi:2-C-methyl-D-erythritol 4-phosphate cytidylyltransferase|nr:2-C-methyl-D-erythritol 4-phosphate cytidylyltransferase [Treponema sp.]
MSLSDGFRYGRNSFSETALAAVVCAAGSSIRMGGSKKEYLLLPGASNSLTVLGAAVSAFAAVPEIGTIVIVVPEDTETGEAAARNALPPEIVNGTSPAVRFVTGGSTRRASVFNALRALATCAPEYVLIHDGARPWISPALIERVITGVTQYRAVIPLLPLTETPKETDLPLDGSFAAGPVFIKRQLKRIFIGTAQTPQAFAFPEILAAHEKAAVQEGSREFTDDAEVWAEFCGPVAAIPGEIGNHKITFPEDLVCPKDISCPKDMVC